MRQKWNSAFITSYERDNETELDYAQARYYSSRLGRFYSVDPENYGANEDDPQSWNGYAYSRNNPILFTDPDGLEYRICDANRENCVTQHDDIVLGAQKKLRNRFVENNRDGDYDSGDILDDEGNKIGTYERTSIDPQYQFIYSGADQSRKKAKLVAGLGLGAVVIGGCIGTGTCAAVGALASRFFSRSALQVASSAAFYAAKNLDKFTVSSKHLLGGAGRYARFSTNSQQAIREIIKEALTSANATFRPNGNSSNSYIIITDLGRTIGTRGETAIKVVFDKTGKIWTAYPVKK